MGASRSTTSTASAWRPSSYSRCATAEAAARRAAREAERHLARRRRASRWRRAAAVVSSAGSLATPRSRSPKRVVRRLCPARQPRRARGAAAGEKSDVVAALARAFEAARPTRRRRHSLRRTGQDFSSEDARPLRGRSAATRHAERRPPRGDTTSSKPSVGSATASSLHVLATEPPSDTAMWSSGVNRAATSPAADARRAATSGPAAGRRAIRLVQVAHGAVASTPPKSLRGSHGSSTDAQIGYPPLDTRDAGTSSTRDRRPGRARPPRRKGQGLDVGGGRARPAGASAPTRVSGGVPSSARASSCVSLQNCSPHTLNARARRRQVARSACSPRRSQTATSNASCMAPRPAAASRPRG